MSPAQHNLVQLTLAAPRHLEDELIEQFLSHPDWAEGFTLLKAEGYSRHHETLSTPELVRGRAERMAVKIVLEADKAQTLLAYLKSRFPKRDVAYWLTPVIEFGRLA